MSIPKEPRQLLVNLMYIVLTALLALNVSAEIINAFFTIDQGLNESNAIMDRSNEQLFEAINQQASAYSQYKPYKEKAMKAQAIASLLYNNIETLRQQIIEEAGGLDEKEQPIRKTDKDITTRLLIQQGYGKQLQDQVLETREALLDLIEEEDLRRLLANSLPLNIPEVPADANYQDWPSFTFKQMPVAAVLPILAKFQNDTKIAETTILNYFLERMNVQFSKPDQFLPVVAADRTYVIRGEPFTGEIFLAAYSSTADNIRVRVDGTTIPVANGKAFFSKEHQIYWLEKTSTRNRIRKSYYW